MTSDDELLAWQRYALHLAHCRSCGMHEIHCVLGQQLRNYCFETDFGAKPPTWNAAFEREIRVTLTACKIIHNEMDLEECVHLLTELARRGAAATIHG